MNLPREMPLFDRNDAKAADLDFAIEYMNKVERIERRYGLSPKRKFEITFEIAAAAYTFGSGEVNASEEAEEIARLRTSPTIECVNHVTATDWQRRERDCRLPHTLSSRQASA
jgi:hypothetical protein